MSQVPDDIQEILPRLDGAATGEPGEPLGAPASGEGWDSLLPQALIVVGVLALTVTLMRRLQRRHRDRAAPTAEPSERLDEIRHRAVAGREPLDRVMADAEELARHLAAVLDAKAARLELLIEEADRKIAAIEAGGSPPVPAAARTPAPAAAPVVASAAPAPASTPTGLSQRDRIYQMADAGRTPIEIARELGQPAGQVELLLALRRAAR